MWEASMLILYAAVQKDRTKSRTRIDCCNRLLFFFQAEDGIRDLTVTGVQTCALPILGRPADRLFVGKNRRAHATRSFAAGEGARNEDRQLAEERSYRLDPVPSPIREYRFWRSHSEIRADESAGLRSRMHGRNLFPAEKGIRYAEKTRACCHCASQRDACAVEARPE